MRQTYLVECYWPGVTEDSVAALTRSQAEGDVAWLESILVPEDEIVLCLFDGPSAEAVGCSSRRSGLPFERITRSVLIRAGGKVS
jgi:hypothetical protein